MGVDALREAKKMDYRDNRGLYPTTVTTTTSSATTMPTYYATNTQLTTRTTMDGRYWLYDAQRDMYYLESDSRVRLTAQQALQIQQGTAILDWKNMRIRYVDKLYSSNPDGSYLSDDLVSGRRMRLSRDYPNLNKLEDLVDEVCQRGRMTA